MSTLNYAGLVALVSLATYLTRYPPLLLGRHIKLTPRLKQGLDFVPLGVFAAMVGPAILHAATPSTLDVAFLVATGVSFVTAIITKNPLYTMIIGIVVIAVTRLLI